MSALQSTNLKDWKLNEVVSNAEQISSYVESKITKTVCTMIEVFPTDKEIPSGTIDSNDKTDENSVASLFDFDNSSATGLTYTFDVPPQMTQALELYVTNNNECDVIIDWGDGTGKLIVKNESVKPCDLNDLTDVNGIIKNEDNVLVVCHTYKIAKKYNINVYGKDYYCLRGYIAQMGGTEAVKSNYNNITKAFEMGMSISTHLKNISSMYKGAKKCLSFKPSKYSTMDFTNISELFATHVTSYNMNLTKVVVDDNFFTKTFGDQTYFNWVFGGCKSLKTATISYNSPTSGLSYMFIDCENLESDLKDLIPKNGFISKTIDMNQAFLNCKKITINDVEWCANRLWNDTSKLWLNVSNVFTGCSDEVRAKVPVSWGGTSTEIIIDDNKKLQEKCNQLQNTIDTQQNTIDAMNEFMQYCFDGNRLVFVDGSQQLIPNDELTSTIYSYKINDEIDNDLVEVSKLGSSISKVNDKAFVNCKSLGNVNLNKTNEIGISALFGCDSLKKVTLKGMSSSQYANSWGIEGQDTIIKFNDGEKTLDEVGYNGNIIDYGDGRKTYESYLNFDSSFLSSDFCKGQISDIVVIYETSECYKVLSSPGYQTGPLLPIRNKLRKFKSSSAISASNGFFYNCRQLTDLDLPNLTAIGNDTINQCVNLSSLNVPKLEILGPESLRYSALTSINLPNVKTVVWRSMINNNFLKSVTFSEKLTDLTGGEVLASCPDLICVDFGDNAITPIAVSLDAFTHYDDHVISCFVPNNEDVYQRWINFSNWSQLIEQNTVTFVKR